ncbi:MAG: uroporphyrinogen-III C-methyltransferase [Burkholderiales bacterium]|nr:uroporphyrinogen-III C-methyltransferase [Burkholderiales bacterium]
MNSDTAASATSDTPSAAPAQLPAAALPDQKSASPRWLWALGLVAAGGLLGSVLVWQKLGNIQEQLARQSADATAQATEARATARHAQELAMETAAKLAVTEARLSEVTLQRTQLEELMQSLSRSRDENMVVDIESAVRLAQQQAQLTGSVEPLLAALKTAELRIARAAQPRLTPLQRAIGRDVARIKGTALADTPALLVQLDELVSLADELPLGNAVGAARSVPQLRRQPDETVSSWWLRLGLLVREEVRSLVRVSRVEDPDAAMLSPEQSFFLRENLKLKLLNARLGLLSRQIDSARADLSAARRTLGKYFDASSRKTQTAAALLQQVQGQMKTLEVPRVEETLAALATAAAGR